MVAPVALAWNVRDKVDTKHSDYERDHRTTRKHTAHTIIRIIHTHYTKTKPSKIPFARIAQGDYNDEEEMEAERDLAEDAQWKRIQQNTFTRWANEHLKTIQQNINALETDLSDGLRLIALIEILSQKRMPKYNKRPAFRSQKLENVSVALKFLENEGIRIVNIGERIAISRRVCVFVCGKWQMP